MIYDELRSLNGFEMLVYVKVKDILLLNFVLREIEKNDENIERLS